MRTTILALSLSGCVLDNQLADAPEIPAEGPRGTRARGMEPLAMTANLGLGVVAGTHGAHAWLGMGEMVCYVYGDSGEVGLDVWIEGDDLAGVSLLDMHDGALLVASPGGGVAITDSIGNAGPLVVLPGDVVGGVLTDDGAVLRVVHNSTCALVATDFAGETVPHPVPDAFCSSDADMLAWEGGTLVGGGHTILFFGKDGPMPAGDGDQLARDPLTGALVVGSRGQSVLRVELDGGGYDIPLSGALVDVAAAEGRLVALVEPGELVRFDTLTGVELDRVSYRGPLGVNGMQMTGTGEGLVLTTPQNVQFYSLGRPAR